MRTGVAGQLLGEDGHGLHLEGCGRTLQTQEGHEQCSGVGLRVAYVGISLAIATAQSGTSVVGTG